MAGDAEGRRQTLVSVVKRYSWISLCLVSLVSVAVAGYFYYQYQQAQKIFGNATVSTQFEEQEIIAAVGKLIELPQHEKPTIATVSDSTKLKAQPFFQNAKNGDKVLIYQKSKKAILYDPVSKKIVEVGPVAIVQTNPTPIFSPTPAFVNVAIYNGTKIVGLASSVARQLEKEAPNVTIVSKDNAKSDSYTKTLVIDLTGKNVIAVQQIAKILNGTVSLLPAGESKPDDADLLIIVGK